ncbi:hypothetical protein ACQP1G_16370 [Nocardia sp. CA-107356]|uniref:hypothetical protein n=1 Tax=Nocardia sp. CA-107356 TaxID=3239972 RepID=UPI003D8D05BB
MTRRTAAQAIVRRDQSGPDTSAHVEQLEKLSADQDFELVGGKVLILDSDTDFPLLLSALTVNEIHKILIPTVLHVTGWLDVMCRGAEVWTVHPPGHWPRKPASQAGVRFVPGESPR